MASNTDRIDVELVGAPQIIAALTKLGASAKRQLRTALNAGGKVFVREEKRIVRVKTGALQKDIGLRTLKSTASTARAGAGITWRGPGSHGLPLERGHKQSGRYWRAKGRVKPYPFAAPTFEAKGQEAFEAIKQKIVAAAMKA